jgi:WD40 repeat protein
MGFFTDPVIAFGEQPKVGVVEDLASGTQGKANASVPPLRLGSRVMRLDGGVRSVAFSPNGKLLAVSTEPPEGRKAIVYLLESKTLKELHALAGNVHGVSSVAFSPTGEIIASGGYDGTIRLWDVMTGKERNHWLSSGVDPASNDNPRNAVNSVAFSPDGALLASGHGDSSVRFWEVVTGRELRQFPGSSFDILSVAFSPDGKLLATGGFECLVRLWEVSTGRKVAEFPGGIGVNQVAFSPDGRILAGASIDQGVLLWDVTKGDLIQRLQVESVLGPSRVPVIASLAFSPDGKSIAFGSGSFGLDFIELCDVVTGQKRQRFLGHHGDVGTVVFSPDGKELVSGASDGTVRLWDVATGLERRRPQGHSGWVTALAISNDGKTIASGGLDRLVFLWDASTGMEVKRLEGFSGGVTGVYFAADDKTLASADVDGTVRLWDLGTGANIRLPQYVNKPGYIQLSMSRETLAIGCVEKRGKEDVWNLRILNLRTKHVEHPVNARGNVVESMSISPDGRAVATVTSDERLHLRDTVTGNETRQWLLSEKAVAVAFSPDSELLATGGLDHLKVWNKEKGQAIQSFLIDDRVVISCVAFSPDGKCLASGNQNNVIHLWEVATGRLLREFGEYDRDEEITSVLFMPDGSKLVSGSTDGLVTIWNLNRPAE